MRVSESLLKDKSFVQGYIFLLLISRRFDYNAYNSKLGGIQRYLILREWRNKKNVSWAGISTVHHKSQRLTFQCLWASLFLLRMERTSETNLRASRTGKRFRRAVSLGSLNHDLIGIALSGYDLYAPGELSRINTEDKSEQMADRSLV